MNAPVRAESLSLEAQIAPMFAEPGHENWAPMATMVAQKWMARSRASMAAALTRAGEAALGDALSPEWTPRFSAWRPEFAIAERAAQQGHAALALLQFALACDPGSTDLRLSATCPEEACLYVDGSLIRVHGNCTLHIRAGEFSLVSDSGAHCFRLHGHRWTRDVADSLPGWACEPSAATAPRNLIRAALPSSQGVFPWPEQRTLLGIALGRCEPARELPDSAAVQAALLRLAQRAPDYADWVAGAIDTLVLLHGEDSSSADFPGLVVLAAPTDALDACESLVSQAARQYLSRLASIVPLIQPGSEEIHYLPERRSYVTTRHLLAQAHEKANVIAMLGMLETDCAATRRRRALRRMQFGVELAGLLDVAGSLTEGGRALWHQLRSLAASALLDVR